MIEQQVYVFMWSIVIGALLALIFDFFRILRIIKTPSILVVFIEDLVYLFLLSSIVIISAFLTNNGEIRGYMIIRLCHSEHYYIISLSVDSS